MRAVKIAAALAAAAKALARHRIGALIVWNPASEMDGGVVLDAVVSRELLVAIFAPEQANQLRIGVTVVRGSRVERAAVPLAWDDLVERAAELATGIAIAVEDSGEIRWMDRTGHVEAAHVDMLARVLYRHALGTGRLAR